MKITAQFMMDFESMQMMRVVWKFLMYVPWSCVSELFFLVIQSYRLKNTLGDWCRTHLSLHRGPDNICNKVDSECAYDSVVEAKGHQNFCEDLLRWKFSFVHLHIFSPKSLNRDLFQILGAYLATMYATLVAVLVLLETSNRNYRIPPYWYCCVYRLIEILPNLQLLNAIF
jgi:hypothetical protein